MRLASLLTSLVLATLAVGPVACGGAADDGSPGAATDDGANDEIRAKVIGDSDNGKTVQVTSGRSFTIALADNGGSTGYVWKVTSVDRSLGYPKESSVPGDASRPGSAGLKKFSWSTKSPLGLVGQHKITIQKIRPWAETSPPAATFEVTVDIVDAAAAPTCGGLIGKTCAAGSYCEFSGEQRCGMADQMGACQTKPELCPAVVMPVCGCDGKTYNNGCEANRAGVSVAANGACATKS